MTSTLLVKILFIAVLLLRTQACDLISELALNIKREILIALADKTLYPDDPVKREEIYNKYKEYLSAYTREEIEWYGLSWRQAVLKYAKISRESKVIEPLKIKYRRELLESLKTNKDTEMEIQANIESDKKGIVESLIDKVKSPFS